MTPPEITTWPEAKYVISARLVPFMFSWPPVLRQGPVLTIFVFFFMIMITDVAKQQKILEDAKNEFMAHSSFAGARNLEDPNN